LLGQRNKEVYGEVSFEEYFLDIKSKYNVGLEYYQSNLEGELINALHNTKAKGIIINAGGYTHSSVAIRDAIETISTPVVEVHISNIAGREVFRHESLISPVVVGCVFGFGLYSYDLAIKYFLDRDLK
jgi:3-dehydroquinate dehydratase-2